MTVRGNGLLSRNKPLIREMSQRSGFSEELCGQMLEMFRDKLLEIARLGTTLTWPGLFKVVQSKRRVCPRLKNLPANARVSNRVIFRPSGRLKLWLKDAEGAQRPALWAPRALTRPFAIIHGKKSEEAFLPIFQAFAEIILETFEMDRRLVISGIGAVYMCRRTATQTFGNKVENPIPYLTPKVKVAATIRHYVGNDQKAITDDFLTRMRLSRSSECRA